MALSSAKLPSGDVVYRRVTRRYTQGRFKHYNKARDWSLEIGLVISLVFKPIPFFKNAQEPNTSKDYGSDIHLMSLSR